MGRQRNLETDYFSIHTIIVPFAVAVLVNSVFINVKANIAAEAIHYQEVYQKPAHKAMRKKKFTI